MSERKNIANGRPSNRTENYGATKSRQRKKDDKKRILGDQDEEISLEDGYPLQDPVSNSSSTGGNEDNTDSYFRDGVKKIDYILVYEEMLNKTQKTADDLKYEAWRRKFKKHLENAGLETEEESVQSEKKMITFIKLHAPWDVQCYYAEDLSLRAPLQAHPNPSNNWSEKLLTTLKIPNIMKQDVPQTPLDYYTCQFRTSKMDKFIGIENKDKFFGNRMRSGIVYEILAKTVYGRRRYAEIGIDRLTEEGVYTTSYPLHDGPSEYPSGKMVSPELLNMRQILRKHWARWGVWYKYQPLDHIRDYFGEQIGIYFAWLGFYTAWLLPAAVVGMVVFAYGLITMNTNVPAMEVCNSSNYTKMCPQCDEDVGCDYWYLSEVCVYVTIAYLFDHPGTVFYAVFIAFWAVMFLEYWKRKTASVAHHWDCMDFEEEEERPRPEYCATAPLLEKNPITGIKEPYFPPEKRFPRLVSGVAVIVGMVTIVIIFILAVMMYRLLIAIPLFENKATRPFASSIASMSASIVNLILIMALGKVYEKLAFKMTQWEMHRTQTEFEDNLTFKVFVFQFVNFYACIFYIAFFKGRFIGYPGHYITFFGLRNEECGNGGCLVELAQQLGVIMIGKQMINNAQEIVIPKVKSWIRKRSMKLSVGENRWEQDFELLAYEGLFQEYLEMVLQFGFITIFVAAFPLAPLFALLNNWVEIRLDAQKLIRETRRPIAQRAQDIGIWFTILDAIANLAVISNAFLIAFTSEFLPKLMYKYLYDINLVGFTNYTLAYSPNGTIAEECRYKDFRDRNGMYTLFYWHLLTIRLAFIIIFEHVVFGINRLIDFMVPDVPESLEIKIKRERYLAKQALADTDALMLIAKDTDDLAADTVEVVIAGEASGGQSMVT